MFLFLVMVATIFLALALAAWIADQEWSWPGYEWNDLDGEEYFDYPEV